jgi:hypothetical protein
MGSVAKVTVYLVHIKNGLNVAAIDHLAQAILQLGVLPE